MLVDRYPGNPLALKLVDDTVDEIFGGDLAEFLADDQLILDDIRTVLDQHFTRLSDLEQQLLFWLAVAREPLSVDALRGFLYQAPPQPRLLEALRSLQRHSLIERSANGFGLQNVIIEYLTDRLVEAVSAEVTTKSPLLLQRQALLTTQAPEYVRNSQVRLLLTPIGRRLESRLGRDGVATAVKSMLNELRADAQAAASYAGGNLLNPLLTLGIDVSGFDFSGLTIRQADLQRVTLQTVVRARSCGAKQVGPRKPIAEAFELRSTRL